MDKIQCWLNCLYLEFIDQNWARVFSSGTWVLFENAHPINKLHLSTGLHTSFRDSEHTWLIRNSSSLTFPLSKKEQKRQSYKQKKQAKSEDSSSSSTPSGAKFVADDQEETFKSVKCTQCSTQVAVYDQDEVYHFFNVLASQSWPHLFVWPQTTNTSSDMQRLLTLRCQKQETWCCSFRNEYFKPAVLTFVWLRTVSGFAGLFRFLFGNFPPKFWKKPFSFGQSLKKDCQFWY